MVSEQRTSYYNKVNTLFMLEYGVMMSKNKLAAELIDEAILIDKKPEDLVKEIAQANNFRMRPDKMN